jgi:hypothetical protein
MEERFGKKVMLRNYGWSSFIKDSIAPSIISLILCLLMHVKEIDIFIQLKHLVGTGITILPTTLALILTAYTIIVTFFIGKKFASIKKTGNGKKLIKDLNASFAVCLVISTISILVMVIISSIINMDIEIKEPNCINYPIYFLVCYLIIYSIAILFGIIIDIFNCGQTTLD